MRTREEHQIHIFSESGPVGELIVGNTILTVRSEIYSPIEQCSHVS